MASSAPPNDEWQERLYGFFRGHRTSPGGLISPSPGVLMSRSPRVSMSRSPRDREFKIRNNLCSVPSPPQLRELWQLQRPQRYTDSASPKGASLTPESHRHALYSPVPSGPWRSVSPIPISDSDDECYECHRLKAENLRLKAENLRLRVQLTHYDLFGASP